MRVSVVPAVLLFTVVNSFPQFSLPSSKSSKSFLTTDSAFYDAVVAPLYEQVRPLLSEADQKRYTDVLRGAFATNLNTRDSNRTRTIQPYTAAGTGDLRSPCPL